MGVVSERVGLVAHHLHNEWTRADSVLHHTVADREQIIWLLTVDHFRSIFSDIFKIFVVTKNCW